ncbi:MAG TPA: SGNH/GDSL hydrolase family protein [Bdellovibrionota bacterium]
MGKALAVILGALVIAHAGALAWSDRHNVLSAYPELYSTKMNLAYGVNGAVSFWVSRPALAENALNLAAWHGHQELNYRYVLDGFPRLSMKVAAGGASVLTLLAYPLDGGPATALRLSSDPLHPTAWLKMTGKRFFVEKKPFEFSLPQGSWVEVVLRQNGSMLEAVLDGKTVSSIPLPTGVAWLFSFTGNSAEGRLLVDDLSIEARNKSYSQDFSGPFPRFLAAAFFLFALAFLFLAKEMAGVGVVFLLTFILGGGLHLLVRVDRGLAAAYPAMVNTGGFPSHIENKERVMDRLRSIPVNGKKKVLWLGGSQAWGAGASSGSRTAFSLVKEALPKELADRFELINGASSAARIGDQLIPLELVAAKHGLAAVVLATGVNDMETDDFSGRLKMVAETVKKKGARLLLIPEPVERQAAAAMQPLQQGMIRFAQAEGIPYVDLQAEFDQAADSGFLWWDFVHLSDAGAEIAARAISPALFTLLRSAPAPVKTRDRRL